MDDTRQAHEEAFTVETFELARQALLVLSPIVAQGTLAKIGEDTTDRVTQLAGRVWALLSGGVQGNPKAESALEVYQEEPDDKRNLERLARYLADYLQQHHPAVDELRAVVEQLHQAQQAGVSGAGAVKIGGDVSNSPITTGSGNTITSIGGDQINAQESQGFINRPTGPVHQQFGDKIGGDKMSGDISVGDVSGSGVAIGHKAQAHVQQGITGTDLTGLFEPIYQQIAARQSPAAIRTVISDHVHKIEDEAHKGDHADAQQIEGWLAVIASMAPDILVMVATALTAPGAGMATTVQKIAAQARQKLK